MKVRIPSLLREITDKQEIVEVKGKTVEEVLFNLENKFPELKTRLRNKEGKLNRFINFYVNENDIRFLKEERTSVEESDELSIIPASAGG